MMPDLNSIKGIHPGAVLKRELKKRNIKSIALANEIKEHPQTINAVTKERRKINSKLSYKLGDYFSIEHDYFMLLQAAFEVFMYEKSLQRESNPLLGKFRTSIFWDTRIELIDYEKNKRSVIQRVLERGNQNEIRNLISIYSIETIKTEILKIRSSFVPKFYENIRKYIDQENYINANP